MVDSNSDDKSYFDRISQYDVIIADIVNKNYESGAFWYAAEHHLEEHYVMIQDSVILKKPLTDIIAHTDTINCFLYFLEDPYHNHMRTDVSEFKIRISEMLNGDFETGTFTGIFGPNFIIHRNLVNDMIKRNLNYSILPINKYDHQITERVYGIVAAQMGIDLTQNTICGNLHQTKHTIDPNGDCIISTDYFDKKVLNRHRN